MRCFYRKEKSIRIESYLRSEDSGDISIKEIESTENFAPCIGIDCPFYYDYSDGMFVESHCYKVEKERKCK